MSTYLAIEAAVLATAIGAGLGFTSANAARDSYRVLDNTKALIVEMGGPTVEGEVVDGYGAHGCYAERHTIKITVAYAVGNGEVGATLLQTLKATTEALKDALRAAPTLGGLVWHSRPAQTSDVKERRPRADAAPTHVLQEILFQVWCVTEL